MKKLIKPVPFNKFIDSRVLDLPGTTKSDTWFDVIGEKASEEGTLPEMYQAYLEWHFKKFTKLGRYLYETED
jgi:hypothetical protein